MPRVKANNPPMRCCHCDVTFKPRTSNQRYCSLKCQEKAKSKRQWKKLAKREEFVTMVCTECGVSYEVNKHCRRKTCGQDACNKSRAKKLAKARDEAMEDRPCIRCGIPFPVRRSSKYRMCETCQPRVRDHTWASENEYMRAYLAAPWSLSFDPYETGALRSDAQFLPVL